MILNGWKEIAAYVNSSVRTVQRWEHAGMPVVRPLASSRGSVIAYSEELDSWLGRSKDGRQLLDATSKKNHSPFSGNFHERLMQAQWLSEQLRKTKSEMADRVRMLQIEVALLKENMARLKVTRDQYVDGQSALSAPAAELIFEKFSRGGGSPT